MVLSSSHDDAEHGVTEFPSDSTLWKLRGLLPLRNFPSSIDEDNYEERGGEGGWKKIPIPASLTELHCLSIGDKWLATRGDDDRDEVEDESEFRKDWTAGKK